MFLYNMRKRIVAGNWKMNLLPDEAENLFNALIVKKDWPSHVQVVVFPPAVYLRHFKDISDHSVLLGVQNFFPKESGAFTGELSVTQAKACGADYLLIGHSERRAYFGEHEEFLKEKVDASLANKSPFIFCCGEPLVIREAGTELQYVKAQLEGSLFHLSDTEILNATIAYEPVWAIGTGKTASSQQAEQMHSAIRNWITEKYTNDIANKISILYGGSCTPDNAKEIFACPNVDGGLIGGASLNAESFVKIAEAL